MFCTRSSALRVDIPATSILFTFQIPLPLNHAKATSNTTINERKIRIFLPKTIFLLFLRELLMSRDEPILKIKTFYRYIQYRLRIFSKPLEFLYSRPLVDYFPLIESKSLGWQEPYCSKNGQILFFHHRLYT